MKITGLTLKEFSCPRPKPIANAILTYRTAGCTICELHTDEGVDGIGLTGGVGVSEIIEQGLKKSILGEDPLNYEKIWDRMYRGWRKPVAKGEAIKAISGVDIAIWDIIGKTLGTPVRTLLGGYREKVPAYAAGGYYKEGEGLKELAQEMSGYVEMGYRAVKMKVGGLKLEKDLERVKTVREAVGEDINLMVDVNNGWNPYEAVKAAKALEKYNVYWLEEPVSPDDVEGNLRVRAATSIPIASGENEFTRWGCRELIERRAVDIIQADATVTGGITESRKIAAIASAYHIQYAPHGSPEVHLHLVASTSNGLIVETYPEDPLRDILFADPLLLKDGCLEVPNRPGLGIELNEKAVEKYRVKS